MWGSLGELLSFLSRTAAAEWITRALFGAGLSFAAYHFAVGPYIDQLKGVLSGSGQEVLQWLGLLRFDQALTVIFSAYTVRFSMNALSLTKRA